MKKMMRMLEIREDKRYTVKFAHKAKDSLKSLRGYWMRIWRATSTSNFAAPAGRPAGQGYAVVMAQAEKDAMSLLKEGAKGAAKQWAKGGLPSLAEKARLTNHNLGSKNDEK